MRWVDVTIPMEPSMTVWPGDPAFTLSPAARIANGATCNVSTLTLSTHTGTHCDAPWHFEDDGPRLHEIDTAVFFGDAQVIDIQHAAAVSADNLPAKKLHDRVLFRTRNTQIPVNGPFEKSFVGIDVSAARRLVDDGVKLVGVDYLSVAPYKQAGLNTHHVLLQAGIFVVEGLLLQNIPTGVHPFVVLPMHIVGADGAPCRAFVGLED